MISLSEEEVHRVRALDVDVRYAYAINMIREHGELWTLKTEDGWVVSRSADGSSSIPIWPHERFAELEATEVWADARPDRISLADDFLTEGRAAWFEENEAVVAVFLAGGSSKAVAYSKFVELLRGKRRTRYDDRKHGSRVARQPKRATRTTTDLVQYVRHGEIDIVIQRIPEELRTPIGDILQRRSSDAKWLGSAYRGTGDVVLGTKLPVRVSLGRYLVRGQAPEEFGAPKLGQWPPWAVRRFLLYDVLFHEIGHLQVVDPKASSARRKFASETRAQEFADELRRTLYSDSFDHPDPIHNAPTSAELSALALWERLDKAQRAHLVTLVLSAPHADTAELARLGTLTTDQHEFLARVLFAERAPPRRRTAGMRAVTEFEDRVRVLEAEVAAAAQNNEPRRLAELLAQLGSNLEAIGQRQRGIELLSRSIALYEEHHDLQGVAATLNRLGSVLLMERPEEARIVLQRALETAREAEDRSEEGTSLNNLAMLEEVAGNLELSRELYERSLELLREVGDRRKLASTVSNLGVALDKAGDDDAAREAWCEALAIHEELGNRAGIASTRNNMGSSLERRGDPAAAVEHYRFALSIQDKVGDTGELAMILGNLAHAYSTVGQGIEACKALRRKLDIEEVIGDRRRIAITLHALANELGAGGITAEAGDCYARATSLFVELGETAEVARVEMDHARAWSRNGDHSRAIAHGEQALALRIELGSDVDLCAALDNIGLIYGEAGDHPKAIEFMERSLVLAEKVGDSTVIPTILCNLGSVCEAGDLDQQAVSYYERALPLVEHSGDRKALALSCKSEHDVERLRIRLEDLHRRRGG